MPIRRGSAAGAAAIAAVHVGSWRSVHAVLLPEDVIARHTPASRIRLWGHHLSGPDHRRCVFVAVEASGRVIGVVSGGPERHGLDHRTMLCSVPAPVLSAAWSCAGIASRACTGVDRDGLTALIIWVLTENPARELDKRLGGGRLAEKTVMMGKAEVGEVAHGWPEAPRLLDHPERLSGDCV